MEFMRILPQTTSDGEDGLPCREKAAYDTRSLAAAAALLAEMKHGNKLKVYHCRYCHLWHLASINT